MCSKHERQIQFATLSIFLLKSGPQDWSTRYPDNLVLIARSYSPYHAGNEQLLPGQLVKPSSLLTASCWFCTICKKRSGLADPDDSDEVHQYENSYILVVYFIMLRVKTSMAVSKDGILYYSVTEYFWNFVNRAIFHLPEIALLKSG